MSYRNQCSLRAFSAAGLLGLLAVGAASCGAKNFDAGTEPAKPDAGDSEAAAPPSELLERCNAACDDLFAAGVTPPIMQSGTYIYSAEDCRNYYCEQGDVRVSDLTCLEAHGSGCDFEYVDYANCDLPIHKQSLGCLCMGYDFVEPNNCALGLEIFSILPSFLTYCDGVRSPTNDPDWDPLLRIQSPVFDLPNLNPPWFVDECEVKDLCTATYEDLVPCAGTICVPACEGKECGDDRCGGDCGECTNGRTCTAGACTGACIPDCTGLTCGDDGCGGSCGECQVDYECGETQRYCKSLTCMPSCGSNSCNVEDGCGGQCGPCIPGLACENEMCRLQVPRSGSGSGSDSNGSGVGSGASTCLSIGTSRQAGGSGFYSALCSEGTETAVISTYGNLCLGTISCEICIRTTNGTLPCDYVTLDSGQSYKASQCIAAGTQTSYLKACTYVEE